MISAESKNMSEQMTHRHVFISIVLALVLLPLGLRAQSSLTFPVQDPPTDKYSARQDHDWYNTVRYSNKVKLTVTAGKVLGTTSKDIIVARRNITVKIEPQAMSGWQANKEMWTETRDFRQQNAPAGQSNETALGAASTGYGGVSFTADSNNDTPDDENGHHYTYKWEWILPYVRVADLQVDSLNSKPYGGVTGSDAEDAAENSATGGKIVPANSSSYTSSSSKPGWADFSAAPGGHLSFAAMHLFLQGFPDTTKVRFNYSGSDPAGVTLVAGKWQLPQTGGCLRVWTKNITEARTVASYIAPQTQYGFADFRTKGAQVADGHFVFYIEAVKGAASATDNEISVEVSTPGSGWVQLQKVRVAPLSLRQENMPNVNSGENTTDMGQGYASKDISGGSVAYITGQPEMPKLIAEAKGAPANVNIQWKLEIKSERTERGAKDNKNYPTSGYKTLAANQPWDIGAEFGQNFIGGKCKLSYIINGGPEQTLEFFIRGKNPKDADAKSNIPTTQYRFAWAMVQHESRQGNRVFNQFNSGGDGPGNTELPNFGAPDGWGIAQLDTPLGVSASTTEVYGWKKNIQTFFAELAEKQAAQQRFFNAVKAAYPNDQEAQSPPNAFTHPGTATSMTALEAGTVTLYNGAGGCPTSTLGGTTYTNPWKYNTSKPAGQRWEYHSNSENYLYKVIYNEFEAHEPKQE